MKTKTQICWWLFAVYRQSFLYLIHFNKYICHMCMYVCMRILRLYTRHKPNTLYAIFCRGRRHKEQGLSFFFITVDDLGFFYVYTFLIFMSKGGGWRCVCVCVVFRLQKVAKIATLRAERTFCLCATTNFIIILSGLFFSFLLFLCFSVSVCSTSLFAVPARLLCNTLHTFPLHYGATVVILVYCRPSAVRQCLLSVCVEWHPKFFFFGPWKIG